FKLGVPIASITPPVPHMTAVLRIVQWAEARGSKLIDLVIGALNQNADNPDLVAVVDRLDLDEGAKSFAQKFESIVNKKVPLSDVETWRMEMMRSERAVCRIEIGTEPNGTGFLIAPGLVVTNYHVVEPVMGAALPAISCRFDFKKKSDGKVVQK